MKLFNFFSLAVYLLLPISYLSAQHNGACDNGACATDYMVAKEIQNNPHAEYEIKKNFDEALAAYYNKPQQGNQRVVRTIPVVFHIVLNTQQKMNLVSDLTVEAQLETLNDDMRKLNADITDVRSIFQGVAADTEIEFCLAQQDPNGNPTDGINRFITTVAAFNVNDDMKSANSGGVNSWDSRKYLNVWVVDLASNGGGSSTAGFAYFPNQHGSSIDGIVLDYTIGFGPNDRSLTHEVGHYLGLAHTWGGGGCNNDDGIDDTPPTTQQTFSCSFTRNTCSNDNPDLPDQVENYMDYSSCPRMWTTIQGAVMRNSLTGIRSSLLSSEGCLPPNSPPLVSFEPSEDFICPGTSVQFFDFSQGNPTAWNWSFPGGVPSSSTQQNPTVSYPDAGTYDVTLTATNGNGSDDLTLSTVITVGVGGVATIFTEDFESGLTGWQVVNPDNSNTWTTTSVNGNSPGSNAAKMSHYNYSNADGSRDGLVSPAIDLSSNTDVVLNFQYAHRRRSSDFADSLLVWVSTDGGATYPHKVFAGAENGSGSFATGFLFSNPFTPNDQDDWCGTAATGAPCIEIDLSQFDGEPDVRIKFETVNDNGNNIYIDNVVLSGTCTVVAGQGPVAGFTSDIATVCGGGQVSFEDASFNNPTSWSWSFPGGSPSSSASSNPVVTYNTNGTYAVSLTVSNVDGSNTINQSSYILVVDGPDIDLITSSPATCAGIDDGSIDTVEVSGGTPPYTYLWDFGQVTPTVSDAPAGTNELTVTDDNGCQATQTVVVDAGLELSLISISNPDSAGLGLGKVSVVATGGSAPYTYTWDDVNSSNTSTLTGLTYGEYTVTAVDANKCEIEQTFFINDKAGNPNTGINDVTAFQNIQLYPNPTSGMVQLDIDLFGARNVEVVIFSAVGQQIIQENLTKQNSMNLQYDLSTYAPGIYYVRIQTGIESSVKRFILLK